MPATTTKVKKKTVAKKVIRKSPPVTAGRIAKGLRLLERYESGNGADPEAKTAMKLYVILKRFFALKGRFKKRYKQKKKKAKA